MKSSNPVFFKNVLFIFLAACIFNPVSAKEKKATRTHGFSASFQDNQFDILVPMWLAQQIVLSPALSAQYVEDGGTDFGFGFSVKFYRKIKRVTPYFGPRIGAFVSIPKGGETVTDFFAGLFYGGEFFMSPQFSIAIEAQANVVKSQDASCRFGNPGGFNINTATAVIANIYF